MYINFPSTWPLDQKWFPSLLAMCLMHLSQPASSVSISWYPTLVGSYEVSHKILRNPNGSHASLRWTNLPYSTSIILIIPKLIEIIMDKFWFRNATIWPIFAHVTLLTTCIENVAFVLVGHTIPCNFLSLFASKPCSWIRGLLCLVALTCGWPRRHRFDRSQLVPLFVVVLGKRRQSVPSLYTSSILSTCLCFLTS
jgi:hypothetical protein